MPSMKSRPAIALLALLNACAVPDPQSATPFELDAVPSLSIGVEASDTSDAYELSRIYDAHRLPDGRILVPNSDPPELRLFDATGKHLRTIGRTGAGPNEFGEFSTLQVFTSGDRLIAPDVGAMRVHLYDKDLSFLETRRFALSAAVSRPFLRGIFADGTWLVLAYEGGGRIGGPPGSVIESRFSLLRYDTSGALLDSLGTFDGAKRFAHEFNGFIQFPYIPLSNSPIQGVAGNSLVVLRGDKPELEYYDLAGNLARIASWQRERVRSAEIIDAYKMADLATIPAADTRRRLTDEDYYKRDLPIPEYAPLYQALLVDAGQRVWLERFRLPRDTSDRLWDVISPQGTWLGVVRTPPRLTLYRIGSDHVLGRSLDSLGVERVELYGLRVRR
jgi:hypothetical protein